MHLPVGEEDWPPGESPAEWVWVTPPGAAMHFGHLEDLVLSKAQQEAEMKRRRKKRKFKFGFGHD